MCGHVGVCGNIKAVHEKAFEQLLIVDTLRGQHSTGIALVPAKGEVKVAKAVGHAFELFDSRQYNNFYVGANRAIIGHNRFATQGAVNKRNAHPFEFDTLVGAHNGTLSTKWKLDDHSKFQVDSENLFHHIEKKGLKDALSLMQGAWALVWWDKLANTMNFLRNKERTLFTCYDKSHEVMFWASEYWMLSGILYRNGIDHDKIEVLPEDQHISIYIDDKGKMEKPKMVYSPSTYVAPVYNGYFPPQQNKHLPPPPVKVEEKKKEPTGGAKLEPNTERIRFVCGATKEDKHGSRYITLHQEEFPVRDIRWYYSGDLNPLDYVGEEVYADLYSFRIASESGVWHRVNPNTVQLVFEDTPQKFVCNCMWCSAPIYEGEPYAVSKEAWTTGDDRLCQECMNDPEIAEYVSIVQRIS